MELPAGISHEIVATLPGYANWTQSVFAEPGKSVALDARLEPIAGARDGAGRARRMRSSSSTASRAARRRSRCDLSAVEHRIEVRKDGLRAVRDTVTPAKGLERAVEYRLTSADRATALLESAPTITTKDGYALKLVPGGTFTMGSERREQGRRPNEGLRAR